jgi:toxin YoeB
MKVLFTDDGWADYASWVDENNRRMLRRINRLIADIQRDDAGDGIGKPELLSGSLSGWASRRIDEEHRLIYRIREETLQITQCRYHY